MTCFAGTASVTRAASVAAKLHWRRGSCLARVVDDRPVFATTRGWVGAHELACHSRGSWRGGCNRPRATNLALNSSTCGPLNPTRFSTSIVAGMTLRTMECARGERGGAQASTSIKIPATSSSRANAMLAEGHKDPRESRRPRGHRPRRPRSANVPRLRTCFSRCCA